MKEGHVSLPFHLKILAKGKMRKTLLPHPSINGSKVVIIIQKIGHPFLDLLKG